MPLWIKRKYYPSTVTVIARIKPGKEPALRQKLADLTATLRTRTDAVFTKLEAVHYARWVILEQDGEIPASLVYSCVTDIGPKAHFADLLEKGSKTVRDIYACCDVPFDAGSSTDMEIARYLTRRNISSAGGFKALRAHTVQQVLQENQLYESIQWFLNQRSWSGVTPVVMKDAIQRHVMDTSSLEWARQPTPTSLLTDFLRKHFLWYLGLLAAFWLTVFMGPFAAAYFLIEPLRDAAEDNAWVFYLWWFGAFPAIFWFAVFRIALLRVEESLEEDAKYPSIEDPGYFDKVKAMEDSEDWGPQNPMSLVVRVRESPLRLFNMQVVMLGVRFACKYLLWHGNLGGIVSIHFADWVFIDDSKRVLFLSNYDGSWEGYLAEFLEGRALKGFNAIYSNTKGYPKTTFLVGRGAQRQARMFKELVRQRQRVTDFWFSAYDYLSVANILTNSAVRDGLWEDMSEKETARWLQKF